MPIEGGEADADRREDDEEKWEAPSPALAPASKLKGKGKKRMEPQDPEESEKETDKTVAATKLDKGKGREVVPVDDSVRPPATQNDKKTTVSQVQWAKTQSWMQALCQDRKRVLQSGRIRLSLCNLRKGQDEM